MQSNNDLKKEIELIRKKYKEKRKKIAEKRDEMLEWLKDTIYDYGKDLSKEQSSVERNKKRVRLFARRQMNDTIKKEADEIQKVSLKYKKLGGSIIAASMIAASLRGYYLVNKDMEEKCKNYKTKKQRDLCVLRLKKKIYEKRIQFLKDITIRCKNAKDPVACKLKVQQHMFKIQDKLDALKRKYVLANTGIYGE